MRQLNFSAFLFSVFLYCFSACECFSLGSVDPLHCDIVTGQCHCLPNVVGKRIYEYTSLRNRMVMSTAYILFNSFLGKRCDQCQEGYWDLHSGAGCVACGCDPIGATTGKCDQESGQCDCLPGVTGQRCDRCMDNYYDLTREGCKCKISSSVMKFPGSLSIPLYSGGFGAPGSAELHRKALRFLPVYIFNCERL